MQVNAGMQTHAKALNTTRMPVTYWCAAYGLLAASLLRKQACA
jgi:hypothetical protein